MIGGGAFYKLQLCKEQCQCTCENGIIYLVCAMSVLLVGSFLLVVMQKDTFILHY